MFFDSMTKVAAKIEVLVSHGFYGFIEDTMEFMHAGFRGGYFPHERMQLSLSTYTMVYVRTFGDWINPSR